MAIRRWRASGACPICKGHPALPQGRGVRCIGYLSSDGLYGYCSREEYAGRLDPHPQASGTVYAHRLAGSCRCGLTHGDAATIAAVRSLRRSEPDQPRPWNVPDSHVEVLHPYFDQTGALAWETVRFLPAWRTNYGAKTKPRQVGADGRWYWGQGAWKGHPAKPLYREREALAELRFGGHVYFTEGERDADSLWDAGLVAMTSGSAGSLTPGQAARIAAAVTDGDDHADPDVAAMAHAEITILADADQTGLEGAVKVRTTLLDACPRLRGRVRLLRPPAGFKDVSEWIANRGAAA